MKALVWLVVALSVATVARAEEPPTADASTSTVAEPDLPPPGTPPPKDQVDAIAHKIASGLRCPVCQGLSVADSPSETAVAMNNRVHDMVAQGYDEDQIRDYFVARYGEWILLEPAAQGFNWVVWLAPGLVGGAGLAMAASVVARWRKEPDPVPLPSDQGLVRKDIYEERLLSELEDDS